MFYPLSLSFESLGQLIPSHTHFCVVPMRTLYPTDEFFPQQLGILDKRVVAFIETDKQNYT